MWAPYSDNRKMVSGSLFPVPYQSWSTTISWEESIGVIKFEAIAAAEPNTESSTSTFFHFLLNVAITNAYILQKGYCSSAPFKTIKEFQMQLANELIDDYCSRRRTGCGSGVVRSLSLHHFPTTISEEDPNKKAKHKRARCCRCYSRSKKSVYTSWYCPECKVWLCHTGERHTDCFMLYHAYLS